MRTPLSCLVSFLLLLLSCSPVFVAAQEILPATPVNPSAEVCQPFFSNPLYWVGTSPSSVAIGDFNGDGIPDLVTAGWFTGRLYVLLGKKNGTFVEGKSFANAATLPRKLVAGDFNNDGKLDVAIADANGSVNVMLGNGDGTFQSAIRTETGAEVDYIAAGDFNHDGNLDIVAVNYQLSQFQVLLGKGDVV